jgi:hypothetical protein
MLDIDICTANAIQSEYLRIYALLKDKKAVDITILKVPSYHVLLCFYQYNFPLETSWHSSRMPC